MVGWLLTLLFVAQYSLAAIFASQKTKFANWMKLFGIAEKYFFFPGLLVVSSFGFRNSFYFVQWPFNGEVSDWMSSSLVALPQNILISLYAIEFTFVRESKLHNRPLQMLHLAIRLSYSSWASLIACL